MNLSIRNKPGKLDGAALLEMADNLRRVADETEAKMKAEGTLTPEWAAWVERQRAGAARAEADARRLLGKPS